MIKDSLYLLFSSLKEKQKIRSYSELSTLLNVSRSLISSWLSGRSLIPIDKLLKISELFNVEIIFKNGTLQLNYYDDKYKIPADVQENINHLLEISKKHPYQINSLLNSITYFTRENIS